MRIIVCLGLAGLAFLACTNVSCACSPNPPPQAVVYGSITDSGAPASRAAMYALATPTGVSCVVDTLVGWGRADSLGRYRLSVFGAGIVDSGCVFVGARFPAAAPNARDTIVGPFRLKFTLSPPFDSVLVNVELAPE